MARCPTCGQTTPAKQHLDADRLLALLRDGVPHREVYRGRDGDWWVTYGGGETTPSAVQVLRDKKLISSVYSDCPDDAFHVGKTLDVKATLAERQKHKRGKDAPKIYTDGTAERR